MKRFFNKNLRYIRQSKGISQQELADKLNLDRSTISRWENDEMDITIGNAIKIADYFNIPIEDFTGRDLSNQENITLDETDVLFNKYKKYLSEKDKMIIKTILEETKKEIDRKISKIFGGRVWV